MEINECRVQKCLWTKAGSVELEPTETTAPGFEPSSVAGQVISPAHSYDTNSNRTSLVGSVKLKCDKSQKVSGTDQDFKRRASNDIPHYVVCIGLKSDFKLLNNVYFPGIIFCMQVH